MSHPKTSQQFDKLWTLYVSCELDCEFCVLYDLYQRIQGFISKGTLFYRIIAKITYGHIFVLCIYSKILIYFQSFCCCILYCESWSERLSKKIGASNNNVIQNANDDENVSMEELNALNRST